MIGRRDIAMLDVRDPSGNQSNIGFSVVTQQLRHHGYTLQWATASQAAECKLVLIALTSPRDVLRARVMLSRSSAWASRKCVAVLGGPGMINSRPLRHLADVAVFGRCHQFICELVDGLWSGGRPPHPSVQYLPDVSPVVMAYGGPMVDGTVACEQDRTSGQSVMPWGISSNDVRRWREATVGCPNKCAFCQYTWSRQFKHTGGYIQSTASGGLSVEILLSDVAKVPRTARRIITAIDGCSYRLRKLYGKGYSDALVEESLVSLINDTNANIIKVYNVANFPSETQDDRDRLSELLGGVIRRARRAVTVVVHTTPFKAEPLTPMQWEGMSPLPEWRFQDRMIATNGKASACHDSCNEGWRSHILWPLVNRYDDASDSGALDAASSASISQEFLQRDDVKRVLSQRAVGSDLPTDYLSSYTPSRTLDAMAQRIRAEAFAISSSGPALDVW